ncbi:MAG: hypothetical protein DPW18_16390 [Chloroflexi bacterium]|nr:hypothetical protein [Chloroflexota bacterium]MDL1943088.1 GAF domain-containing protein [Chloroflexi bacterium CFX2]
MNKNPASQNTVRRSSAGERKPLQSTSLRTRLLTAFALLAVLPVLITGTAAAFVSAQGLRNAVFDELDSVATLKEAAIRDWLEVLQTSLNLVYENHQIEQGVYALLQNDQELMLDQDHLRRELSRFDEMTGYFVELFVMNTDGEIVLSTDPSQEGKIQINQAFFQNGLTGDFISPPAYEVSLDSYSIVLSEPIQTSAGKTIGVLGARVNLSTLSEIMEAQTGLGEAGETYLVSSNFAALTNLKHIEFNLGETYIRTRGVTNAMMWKTSGTDIYTDYAGNPTFGAYRWIPELQVVLIAEHDQRTALQAANRVFQIAAGLMAVTALLAVIIAFIVTRAITTPIANLANVADSIAQGNLDLRAEVTQRDEIGLLASSFNTMTARLRELISTLEQRVRDRTRALATSTEVSRRLSTILDRRQLVSEVVNEIRNAFGYYHAQIYLYNEETRELIMAGGTGRAGAEMIAKGHKLLWGQGLVGRAAETRKPVLVPDTTKDANWLSNPLLPDTLAEMAVPIVTGDTLLGVLDIQHNIPNGLNADDLEAVRSIANQIAVALQNIASTEHVAKRANQLETVATVSTASSAVLNPDKLLQTVVDLTKERFNLYHAHIYLANESWDTLLLAAGAGEVGRQMTSTGHAIQMDAQRSLVARAYRERNAVIVNDVHDDEGFLPNPLLPHTHAEMAAPMIAGGKVLGVFDVQSEQAGYFKEEDALIFNTLAAQVAVALQNARLYQEQAATLTQLRELDRLKSSFLANMSHELRTPLNSILGFTDVMLEGLDGALTPYMQNDLTLIRKNGQHLLHLINDVLDMAKIESGTLSLNIEKFNLQEVVEEAVSIAQPLAGEKALEIVIEAESGHEVEVNADRIRLRQVLINIVNNAVKFTEKGRISVRAVREANNVLITVKDTGIGIPPSHLESIFQEFTQVDSSTTRRAGGTGLGLPISRRLIQMHGGRLWAESAGVNGEGSTFYIFLPIEARVVEPEMIK